MLFGVAILESCRFKHEYTLFSINKPQKTALWPALTQLGQDFP
jgi:hypothetical protein